jgi:hypothetical protein
MDLEHSPGQQQDDNTGFVNDQSAREQSAEYIGDDHWALGPYILQASRVATKGVRPPRTRFLRKS